MIKEINAVLLAAAVSFAGVASAEEALVLRYNQWFPSQHWSQKDGLLKYFDEVAAVTDGRVKILPSAKPLAPPTRNYQAVTSGIADVAWGPHGYMSGVFPLTELVEFPFITEDAGVSSKAYWRLFEQYFKPAGLQQEVVTLAMHVTSGVNLHMKEEPVTTAQSLAGKKIRIATAVASDALKMLSVVPISGPLSELREFLSRGVIDGTAVSDELSVGFKVDKYINGITQIPGGLYANSAFLVINKEKWNKISETDREAISSISGEVLSERMGRLWHKNDLAAQDQLKGKLGDKYLVADKALLDVIDQAFEPARQRWYEEAGAAGVDGQAAMQFYREQVSQLSDQLAQTGSPGQ